MNTRPAMEITAPAEDTTVSRGGFATFSYTDSDPDNEASTQLFADVDGLLESTDDQTPLSEVRPELDGTPQTLTRDISTLAEGSYVVFAVTSDGVHAPVVTRAPGRLIVDNVAFQAQIVGGEQHNVTACDSFADGSSVVGGNYRGTITLGEFSKELNI